ncbi:hypothetical protein SARC_17811, partial [Sphaeroforma arctica JP610]
MSDMRSCVHLASFDLTVSNLILVTLTSQSDRVATDGKIDSDAAAIVCDQSGERQPGYKLRHMVQEADKDSDGAINWDEFLE